jgi:hypothetical protein
MKALKEWGGELSVDGLLRFKYVCCHLWFELSFPTSVPTSYPTIQVTKETSTPTTTLSPTSQPSTAFEGFNVNNVVALLPKVPRGFTSYISMSSDLDHENYNSGSSGFTKFRSTLESPKPAEFAKVIIDATIYRFGRKPYSSRVECTDKDLSNKIGVSLKKNDEFDVVCDNNRWVYQSQYKFHIDITNIKNLSNLYTDTKDLANVLCVNCKPMTGCLVSTSDNIFVLGTDDLCFESYNKTKVVKSTQRLFGKASQLQEYNAIKVATSIQLEVRTFTPKTIPDIANIVAQPSNTSIIVVIIIIRSF